VGAKLTEVIEVPVGSSAYLFVDEIHGRLQLFADDQPWLAVTSPGHWRIARDREYFPIYDNNEGGYGVLSVWVAATADEDSWDETPYVIYFDDVEGPEVRELPPFEVATV
jgi:hypothetical protein